MSRNQTTRNSAPYLAPFFPPLAAAPDRPTFTQPAPFPGPRSSPAQIIEVCARRTAGLSSFRWTGGTGKTTLVTRLARQMAGDPFTTIIWSSAIGKADWGLTHLLRISATCTGCRQAHDARATATARPRISQNRADLLICDNLNTVTAEADQRQVSDFLASMDPSAGSRLLLTSRREDPGFRRWLIRR